MNGIARSRRAAGKSVRGVHPPQHKRPTADDPIQIVPTPAEVRLPLLQHTGAPCVAAVRPRQKVDLGELVGDTSAFISAPVHASIAGTTARASAATLPDGRRVQAVPIKAGEEQLNAHDLREAFLGGEWPQVGLERYAPDQIVQAVRQAGIVGQGGAAFPTHVKLTTSEERPIDTVLVNGCECEPYLTADQRLMVETPGSIVTGALLAGRATRARDVVVAIEDNKPSAAEAMRRTANCTGVEVVVIQTKYPMGGERQLIPGALGREVPTKGLPLDVGVVVLNVGTAAAVARAVVRGLALTHRVVTVSGAGVRQPKNLLVPIGISYGELVSHCGGVTRDAVRAVSGGPMMGFALSSLDTPVTKGTSGLVLLTADDVRRAEETVCVRCGRCTEVCPLHLVPTKLAEATRFQDWELARRYQMVACCECGCCAYACPAQIPLVQLIRTGKTQMLRNQALRSKQEEP